jgi:hypothetical protein
MRNYGGHSIENGNPLLADLKAMQGQIAGALWNGPFGEE